MVQKVSYVAVGLPQLPCEITPNGPPAWSLPHDTHEDVDMLGRRIRQDAVPYVEDMRAIVQRS